jgi:ABC-2 type transport system ATP-binding protein
VLEAVRLTKTFNLRPAVDEVSFTVSPGEILGYLGPNGSGKSTTVKMLTGLIEPTRGQILYQGSDIRANMQRFRCKLGYVPEEPHLYPYLAGREYLQLAGRLRGMPERLLNRKIDEFLDLYGLYEAKDPDRRGFAS